MESIPCSEGIRVIGWPHHVHPGLGGVFGKGKENDERRRSGRILWTGGIVGCGIPSVPVRGREIIYTISVDEAKGPKDRRFPRHPRTGYVSLMTMTMSLDSILPHSRLIVVKGEVIRQVSLRRCL